MNKGASTSTKPPFGVSESDPAGPPKRYDKIPHPPTKLLGTEVLRLVNGYCQALSQYDTIPFPKNTYGHPVNDFTFPDDIFSASKPPYRFKVEMEGFLKDEISYEYDDKALYIIGYRSDRDGVSVRTMTETCVMPPGMYAENTKVSRDLKGTLYVEGRYVE